MEIQALSDMQKRIVEAMAEDPGISAERLSEKLDIGDRNVKKHIKLLKEAGILERVGATKNGKWIVKGLSTDDASQ